MKTALISVSNKEGIVDFARQIAEMGYEIISSGGTASLLKKEGVKVTLVSDYTGSPEILDGRVKTLHPKVHGGILALRGKKDHLDQIEGMGIREIDLVVVNLYPFEQVLAKGAKHKDIIENIDIGGPSMVRSAAKNYESVCIVVDPGDYDGILKELKCGKVSAKIRQELAAKAFSHTARYDSIISRYVCGRSNLTFPDSLTLAFDRIQQLRYGENPNQRAAFYADAGAERRGIAGLQQLHGKELSFNNILDANAAVAQVQEFGGPAVAIIKHNNPCGVATANDLATAYAGARATDPVSAFGSVIALNREVDADTAGLIAETFVEVVIAPSFSVSALDVLTGKKNMRLLKLGEMSSSVMDVRLVNGGALVQTNEPYTLTESGLRCVTKRKPSKAELSAFLFGWKVVRNVKSNAIIFTNDHSTLAIGAGQMSRIDAAELAVLKAKKENICLEGSVLSSDAFFPFNDVVEFAAGQGVTAIIQPGGSVRDQDSIDACNRHGIAMVFTGIRSFRH
ncbi:MAG: bifunctional phosphoribosylaminoimidazolecarboxamide formyltransferase/IMP cyclohydrolase [archaeon]